MVWVQVVQDFWHLPASKMARTAQTAVLAGCSDAHPALCDESHRTAWELKRSLTGAQPKGQAFLAFGQGEIG